MSTILELHYFCFPLYDYSFVTDAVREYNKQIETTREMELKREMEYKKKVQLETMRGIEIIREIQKRNQLEKMAGIDKNTELENIKERITLREIEKNKKAEEQKEIEKNKETENKKNEAKQVFNENKELNEDIGGDDIEAQERLILNSSIGRQMLVVNGYQYFNEPCRGWKIEWRCSKRISLGCKAYIVTVRERIVHHQDTHNHSNDQDRCYDC